MREFHGDMAAESGRGRAKVDGDIHNRTDSHTHQLSLCSVSGLEMETAHNSDSFSWTKSGTIPVAARNSSLRKVSQK